MSTETYRVGSRVVTTGTDSPQGIVVGHSADGWPEVEWEPGQTELEAPTDIDAAPQRVPINIDPLVRDELRNLLVLEPRLKGVGYSEFIAKAIDAYRR